MCCVGTKNLISDYQYVVRKFVESNALSSETAISFADLGLECSEHLFARDNFLSMLRVGDIVREGEYYYLAKRRRGDERQSCQLGAHIASLLAK